MRLLRIFIAFLIILFLFITSCSKEKTLPGATSSAAERNQPFAKPYDPGLDIVSASLSPEAPFANTPLNARYESKTPESSNVQYLFRWYVNDLIAQEGPASILEPGNYRKGSSVYVEIIASDSGAAGRPYKTELKKIGNLPPAVTSIVLTPLKPVPGDVITAAATGEDPDGDLITYRYQWTVNGEPVAVPSESNAYTARGLRKKDRICVVVTPSDGESTGRPTLSEIVQLGNSVPRITSAPPMSAENSVYTYQVTATDPDGDQLTYSLVTAPGGMTINPSTGLIRWELPKQVPEKQEITVKVAADDGDGGIAYQEYSLFLEMK